MLYFQCMLRYFLPILLCLIVLFCFVYYRTLKVQQKEIKDRPLSIEEQKRNKMWQLWAEDKAESPYAELMTYQAEVNNGGHDQYFFNVSNTGDLEEEMSALMQILPETHRRNLEKAYEAFLTLENNEDDESAVEVLNNCDSVFWENEAAINQVLEKYASTIEL